MKKLLLMFALLASPLSAQSICDSYEGMAQKALSQFGETPYAAWQDQSGVTKLMLVNQDEGTWTILALFSADRVCVVTVGNGFILIPQGELL